MVTAARPVARRGSCDAEPVPRAKGYDTPAQQREDSTTFMPARAGRRPHRWPTPACNHDRGAGGQWTRTRSPRPSQHGPAWLWRAGPFEKKGANIFRPRNRLEVLETTNRYNENDGVSKRVHFESGGAQLRLLPSTEASAMLGRDGIICQGHGTSIIAYRRSLQNRRLVTAAQAASDSGDDYVTFTPRRRRRARVTAASH